ncbi:MAG: PEPxxWA-CTERM sorting domain-containing protein [Phenylobacterium sp.]|nr:PEPxxWA-CTERM sorting domain-containing protein [Phenylobacterium sp.]
MKKFLLAAASAALLAGLATSANAAITVVAADPDDLYGTGLGAYGQVMLEDFDSISNGNTSFVGNVIEYPAEFEDPIVTSAPPPYSGGIPIGGATVPVDPTNYASVLGGSSATFSVLSGSLRSFSFYLGSPDTYNKLTFNLEGGGTQVMEGDQIWGGFPPGTGDRSLGYRVYYDFGGARVSSITFESSSNSFEFDGLAGAIPEPATWAMMIMGFGAAGSMIRSRRRAFA